MGTFGALSSDVDAWLRKPSRINRVVVGVGAGEANLHDRCTAAKVSCASMDAHAELVAGLDEYAALLSSHTTLAQLEWVVLALRSGVEVTVVRLDSNMSEAGRRIQRVVKRYQASGGRVGANPMAASVAIVNAAK